MRFNPFFSLFAASLIALLPLNARAQETQQQPAPPQPTAQELQQQRQLEPVNPDNAISVRERPRPELDPQGARVGAFRLDAALGLDVTSTDNLFAEAEAPVGSPDDDIIYTVSPYVRLASGWSRHSLSVEAGGAFNSHEDFSNEDADSYFARIAGRYDLGANTSVNAAARYGHEFTPRTDPDSPIIGSPVEFDRTDYNVGIEHRFARLIARADYAHSERDYDTGFESRNNERDQLRARLDIELSPRIGLLVQGTLDQRDYEQSLPNDLSSEGASLLVGATINGNLMRGEISVGQFERDYDFAGFGSVDGVAVAGELEWYATQLTTVTFNAARTPEDSPSINAPYITTEYGARVDHELLRNLILTAGVLAGEREFESITREDEYVRYDVGADYLLNRRVALHARYAHDDVDSTDPTRTFEIDAVTVGLTLRL